MGRPPGNGAPSFRFNATEVAEMEAMLQAHDTQVPSREVLDALAEKFTNSPERLNTVVVQMKQVWNWFQNRRYAIRSKAGNNPGKLRVSMPQTNSGPHITTTQPIQVPIDTVQNADNASDKDEDDYVMDFEARSIRDGAWYDVESFLSHRTSETGDPEVLVCFAGFGPEEDEWVNVYKNVRQRSLPCDSSECVAVLPGDLVLCFQEGKEQALYYDAHVLDSQRRRHDVRGCRCRFLVRYDHDQYEEIVPLRKICRRPETDYRMHQLHAEIAKENEEKNVKVESSIKLEETQIKGEEVGVTNPYGEKTEMPLAEEINADIKINGTDILTSGDSDSIMLLPEENGSVTVEPTVTDISISPSTIDTCEIIMEG